VAVYRRQSVARYVGSVSVARRRSRAGPRVEYVCDRIEDASFPRRFDAATSLLVAHFIDGNAAKQRYFHALAEWLRPDAPLVWADLYRPTSDEAYRAL
jgi:tRNA (cmo5U34)-methyltransferase